MLDPMRRRGYYVLHSRQAELGQQPSPDMFLARARMLAVRKGVGPLLTVELLDIVTRPCLYELGFLQSFLGVQITASTSNHHACVKGDSWR